MTYRTALDRLGALIVPGVTNYPMTALPATLDRAHIPALLVLPGEAEADRLFAERGSGFMALAFQNGPRTLSVTVTHLLLTAPVQMGVGARAHLPELIDHIDAYLLALGADVTLGGALAEPVQVGVEPGEFRYGGGMFHGCAFRHRWMLEVAP
jgi:hypothetical protein